MSRSRNRKYYDDYGYEEEYFEIFDRNKKRRQDRQKKANSRESFDNDIEENDYANIHNSQLQNR